MQFASTAEGDIERLMVPLEPSVAPIVFRRLPSGPDPAPGRDRETDERARALCDRIVAKTDYICYDTEL